MSTKTRPHFANNRALGNDSPGKNAPEPTVVYGSLQEALIGIAKDEAAKVQAGDAVVPAGPIAGVPEGAKVQKIMCRCGWKGETIEAFNAHEHK
jgi:hypothetical protein